MLRSMFLSLVLIMSLQLHADHDEATDGDLSNDPANPTIVSVVPGSNLVSATSSVTATLADIEYFSITVPDGHELAALNLVAFPGSRPAFLAFQEGSTFTEPRIGTDVSNLLGWTHLDGPINIDQLPIMAAAPGVIGYTPPLAAGTYTFWAQETSSIPSSYTLDFVVTALPAVASVPTLSQWSLIILGLMICIFGFVAISTAEVKMLGV